MARRSPYSARERVLVLLQQRTQKEVARILGVSDRTVRRWKNESVVPVERHDAALTHESNRERRRLTIHNKRLSHGKQPAMRDVPVIPVGVRRALKEYKNGKFTGRFRESEWVNYSVEKLSQRDVFALVGSMRRQFLVVQFIFDANKDDPAATGRFIIDKVGNVRKIRGVSVPQDMSVVESDADVADLIAPYYPPNPRKLLWFAVHDRKRGFAKRRRRKE